ncbi:MAG TPA: hypothetical protein VIJ26_04050, partial [Thermoanaerobaculia bacterium]
MKKPKLVAYCRVTAPAKKEEICMSTRAWLRTVAVGAAIAFYGSSVPATAQQTPSFTFGAAG